MGLFPSDRLLNSLIMVRGPKMHMKRLAAPKSWMLDKLGGVYSVKPSSGPHRQGECMPISIFLRNRLKYALTAKEVSTIMKQRLIKVDGKVRTDARFPAGFMDVIQIEKTGENFRLIYDVKGRYIIHRIKTKRPNTSCAVSVKSRPDPKMSLICILPMDAPFVTPTPLCRPMILSGWTLIPTKS